MTTALSTPLFILARKDVPEIVVHGASIYHDSAIESSQLPQFQLVARDLLKPWQFLAADVIGHEDFWALGLSSHSGEPMHLEALSRFAAHIQAGENELFCPRGYPFDWEISTRLKLSGEKPSRFHHPCSGKHLLMIAACRKHNFAIDSYWDISHPLQKRVLGLVGREAGEQISWVTDNCGLPTAITSSRTQIHLWEKLAFSEDIAAVALKELWIHNPRMIGGRRRLDSALIEVSGGRLLAKEGGNGLLMVQSLPNGSEKVASCLIKLASGYRFEHLALALWAALSPRKDLPPAFVAVVDYLRDQLPELIPQQFKLHLPTSLNP
jgi:L-asparaginase II